MKKLLWTLLLLLPSLSAQQWSVGYWTPWGNPGVPISGIQWDGLTHVVQWGALVRADGTLDLTTNNFSANAPTLIAAAHSANVKVILGLTQPYWQGQTTNYQQAVTNNRAAFVSNVMKVVNTYGFDGVDIDWEPFSGGTNGAAMTALISDLRAQLGTRALTVATIVTDYAYWGTVHQKLDRVNVMTYDMSGKWDPYTWHNAALYGDDTVWSIDLAVRRYTAAGVPAAKLGIGIPFYGWQWTGPTGPKQAMSSGYGMSQVGYHNFDTQINSSTYRWDSTGQVPYLSTGSSFLSYDNEQSIAAKVNYAKTKGLGGWIIWALDHDYFPDRTPQHPLMTAVRNAMGGTQPPPAATAPSITTTSPLPNATVSSPYSLTLASTGTAPITWSVASGALPQGLALNASTGVISGTPTLAGTFSVTLRATNSAGNNSKQFDFTVANAVTPPSITTSSLPAATTGVAYSATLTSNGSAPITWRVSSGTLPAGLSLNGTTGAITGTPTAAGTYSFTVAATNSAGSSSKVLSIAVTTPQTPPTITNNATLPAATTGTPYTVTLAATGTAPMTWALASGALPAGLALNATTGTISGTPTTASATSFSITATNTFGSNTKAFTLNVSAPSAQTALWSTGYWMAGGNPGLPVSEIDFSALTHVIQFAAVVNADGTLDLNTYGVSQNAAELVAKAHASGVKALLAVTQPAGQTSSGNFYLAATNNLSALTTNIVNAVNSYGFDGVDIYWQPFSASTSPQALTALATELRTKLGTRLMTTAAIVTDSAFWGTIHDRFDRVNVRTFDLTGTWNPYSWHNAALYDSDGLVWSIDGAVRKFRQGGIPADKIGIGLPFFGYQWTGGGVSGPRQTWSTLPAIQAVPYQSFASQLNSTNVVRDSAASVPYLTNNSSTPSYLTFDDATSIAAKVNYAKTQGLGGWIIWTLGGDYLPTSSDRTPLLSAVRSALGATATAPSITSASSLPPATSGTAYTYTLTSSGTSPISWRVTGGALPTGLTLNASTGAISGVPTTTGTFSFTAEASNTVGTNSRQFSLTVSAATQSVPPSITILTPYSGTVRKVTEITVQVSQSVTSVVYRVDGQPFATVTKAPFSYVGEIPNSGNNGTHFLDAVASDAAGRTATSQRVSIRIR